jgi:very-short-patch-repair endonuclease
MNAALGPYEPGAFRPEQRLVVELDSYGIHTARQAFEADRERDRALQANGYRVVRVTWRQLHAEPHEVAEHLRTLLTAGPRPR